MFVKDHIDISMQDCASRAASMSGALVTIIAAAASRGECNRLYGLCLRLRHSLCIYTNCNTDVFVVEHAGECIKLILYK